MHPGWPAIQLIENFIERFVQEKYVQKRAKILGCGRDEIRVPRDLAIGTQEFGGDRALP